MQLLATTKKIKYFDEVSSWSAIEFMAEDGSTFIGTGLFGHQYKGYALHMDGKWENDPRGGKKVWRMRSFNVLPPTTKEGIYLYLTSGIFKGFTKGVARYLIDTYGENAIKFLNHDISIVTGAPGVGVRRYLKIRESYLAAKPAQENILRLHQEYGFSYTESLIIEKEIDGNLFSMLEKAPYALCSRINKIPFVRFDAVFMSMGISPSDPNRIREVIQYMMNKSSSDGNTVAFYDDVCRSSIAYLRVDPYLVHEQMSNLIEKRFVCDMTLPNGRRLVQTRWLFSAEKEIANRLALLMSTDAAKPLVFDPSDSRLEKLKPHQLRAAPGPFKHKVVAITGRPGAGKTTLRKTIVDPIEDQNVSILAVSPTGKAAQRLREVTRRDCSTVHRALGATHLKDEFVYNDLNPLDADVILVDEMSMLDTNIFRSLLRAIPSTSRLVLIGDVEQLPSVKNGAVFRDVIQSKVIPTYWLTQVLRFSRKPGDSENRIPTPLKMSNYVREGKYAPPPNDDEFAYYPTKNNAETIEVLIRLLHEYKARGGTEHEAQIFAPTNNDELGVSRLNPIIKRVFHPDRPEGMSEGDKIMQTENNYDLDIYNGDIGIVQKMNDENAVNADGIMMEALMAGEPVAFKKKQMYSLVLAYGITGHKSQGSEYPHVFIVIPDHFYGMMDRFWLYTLITRCQSSATIIGNDAVLRRVIKNKRSHMRETLLKEKLLQFLPPCGVDVK